MGQFIHRTNLILKISLYRKIMKHKRNIMDDVTAVREGVNYKKPVEFLR